MSLLAHVFEYMIPVGVAVLQAMGSFGEGSSWRK